MRYGIKIKLPSLSRHGLRCRGMTLIEVVVAVSLMSMVFLAVGLISSTTAKQVQTLYGDARTLHRAHLVLDRIRYKLCMAKVGTPVVKDEGHTLEFTNPSLGGKISAFKFINGKVYYYEDKTQAASTPGQGIGLVKDLTFQVLGPGNGVRMTVITLEKFSWKLDRPFTLNTEVTMRN